MRACLISSRDDPQGEIARSCRRRAELLARRHEVTVVYPFEAKERMSQPSGSAFRELFAGEASDLAGMAFTFEDHRYAAEVLEAIERAYGSTGPDFIEACDRGAPGLVALQARRTAQAPLRNTSFVVRLVGSGELRAVYDHALSSPPARRLCDLEREQLRLADRIVWPGGDLLDLYRRYYSFELPEAIRVAEPFPLSPGPPRVPGQDAHGPLRLLYVGELRRHEGALDLAVACLRLPVDDWVLTMAGPDTPTAPAGSSIQLTIEAMFAEDPRLQIVEGPPDAWPDLLAGNDLLVIPATFAAWPEVAMQAMKAGVPVLATPVGGLTELVDHGTTGWLAASSGPEPLREALLEILQQRPALQRMRQSGESFERLRGLVSAQPADEAYELLLGAEPAAQHAKRRPHKSSVEPLVSGIVPYFHAAAYVEEAVASLLAQTHGRIEVIVVNDGSFEESDGVLDRLAANPRVTVVTKPNGGDGSARNLGAIMARGEYVAMLDADNVLEPDFVARALEAFAWNPELAYVSCWLRFITPDGSMHAAPAGYAPLGNTVLRDDDENWDADALALMPRRLFTELGYRYEEMAVTTSDWEFYRRLREDERFGAVIPARLARYRVVPDSVLRSFEGQAQRRAWGEALDRRRLRNPAGYWGEAAG
jgi:glycosyltransferase involved in cell wall biosynthesis/GT2 family glycosyltransferase